MGNETTAKATHHRRNAPLLGYVLWEEVMLHYKLYYYYGNQPFLLIKFPLYQPAGNSTGELLGVTALFFLRPCLTGAWRWFWLPQW